MSRPHKPKLSIIEGKWFPRFNVSVQEIARPLSVVWPHKRVTKGAARVIRDRYHYEMFTTKEALRHALRFAFSNNQPDVVYVAAHGDESSVQGFHQQSTVSRTIIKNAINTAPGTTQRGVLFGACHFGTATNAKQFLSSCPRLAWVAGYTASVDWVESTLLDMYFLYHCLYPGRRNASLRERARIAAEAVTVYMHGLAERLHFHIYVRQSGPGATEVTDLLGNP